MSFALGNVGEERNEKAGKERELTLKEVCAYSGEKPIFTCYGAVEVFSDGMMVRVTETDGRVSTIYNAAVIVRERTKK